MAAGLAKTSEFLLSQGTIMVGESAKVMELTPEEHSLGLVKNVQISTDPQWTDLTQGIDEQVVCSVNTRNQARVSAEVYEFTAKNLAYANGLNAVGSTYSPDANGFTLGADVAADATEFDVGTGEGASLAAGDYMVIQSGAGSDKVIVARVGSVATDTVTLADGYSLPYAITAAAARVYKVHDLAIGGQREDVTLGVKIVGLMAKDNSPITMIFPKTKITNGLGLSLTNSDFTNMPFEFMPYALLPEDPFYDAFPGQQGKILKR